MLKNNKKPGAMKRPGKVKTPRKHSPYKRILHQEIAAEAERLNEQSRPWTPSEFPLLYGLLRSAIADARNRRRLRGRIIFCHEGKQYAARFTSLDRIIVENRETGQPLCSSGFFAL